MNVQARRLILTALVVPVLVGAMLSWAPVRERLHAFDRNWLDERVIDTWARLRGREDWQSATPLGRPQDYRWLATTKPLRIAHALGRADGKEANQLSAFAAARQDGFRLYEVDVWLHDGTLYCHHGPTVPSPGGCRIEQVLKDLPAEDAWLVLDIKTDFAQTGAALLKLVDRDHRARQIIFQLYEPSHLSQFARWQAERPLPGPIVTLYRAHRSVRHVLDAVPGKGIGAVAMPTWRMPAWHRRASDVPVLIHPIHDCTTWRRAVSHGAAGLYTLNGLHCQRTGVEGSAP